MTGNELFAIITVAITIWAIFKSYESAYKDRKNQKKKSRQQNGIGNGILGGIIGGLATFEAMRIAKNKTMRTQSGQDSQDDASDSEPESSCIGSS